MYVSVVLLATYKYYNYLHTNMCCGMNSMNYIQQEQCLMTNIIFIVIVDKTIMPTLDMVIKYKTQK